MNKEREILKNIFGYNEFRPTTDIDNTPNILRSIFPANISGQYFLDIQRTFLYLRRNM